jgi:hypothetical protein
MKGLGYRRKLVYEALPEPAACGATRRDTCKRYEAYTIAKAGNCNSEEYQPEERPAVIINAAAVVPTR